MRDCISFNPRTRVGCDHTLELDGTCCVWFQSTHPRGVRQGLQGLECFFPQQFQSTHPRGVRLMEHEREIMDEMFQSTHPRGVRPGGSRGSAKVAGFNPRTRVGCDSRMVWSRL